MQVEFAAEKVGINYRGIVIDLRTYKVLRRTGFFASPETAKAAAASMWRAINREQVAA